MVVDAGKEMIRRGLTVGTWGNVSVRDPETGYVYLTPSGMNYDRLECDDIVVFDREGNWVEGERRPSIEKSLHISIYRNRPDVNAVLHTHPVYSTVFCVIEQDMPPVTEEFVQIIGEKVCVADYALPGTELLAQNAVRALGHRNAVLLKSHGSVCVGPDLDSALKVCDVLEKSAHILLMSIVIGTPRVIPPEDIAAMQEFVKTQYGQK